MSATPGAIVRSGGISKTVFVISLIVVAVISGATGYFLPGALVPAKTTIIVNGDGATFPYPFLSAVASNYTASHSGTHINYQPVGSTQGVKDFTARIVDFAASDRPMTDTQRSQASNALHIPEVVGAVAIAYRIKNNSASAPLPTGLVLNNTVVAKIFNGDIQYWNDSAIRQLNPSLAKWLPGQNDPTNGPIKLVTRGDGSGTAFIFSFYLNQSGICVPSCSFGSPSTLPTWRADTVGGLIQAQGNQGVAAVVQRTFGTIGFVELNYVLSATPPITYAYVANKISSNPIIPTLASVSLAVANPPSSTVIPNGNQSWTGVSLTNSPDPNAYPIVGYTYVLVYQELNVIPGMTQAKAAALADFLWFLVHEGQQQAPPLSYASLPAAVLQIDENSIRAITFNGAKLHN